MKVTIGLPVYNAEKHVKDAIISIKNQTIDSWTCIIVDDGSKDDSIKIIEDTIKDDSRFKLIVDGQNLGLPSRLNQIASLCNTKYLARMDSDDIMVPSRIAIQLNVLEGLETVDIAGSDAYIIDIHNKLYGLRRGQVEFNTQNALRRSLFIHPTVMGKTEWFKTNPYNSERRRSEDYELWLRTVRHSSFIKIDKPLLFYREVGLKHASKYDTTMAEIMEILSEQRWENDPVFLKQVIEIKANVKLKREIFQVISSLGLESFLLKRRRGNLNANQRGEAELALKRALMNEAHAQKENNVLHTGF